MALTLSAGQLTSDHELPRASITPRVVV